LFYQQKLAGRCKILRPVVEDITEKQMSGIA